MENRPLVIAIEEDLLREELQGLFTKIKAITAQVPPNVREQVMSLFELRSEVYEDINQLQHKSLIIMAAKRLLAENPLIDAWTWHPKQTSSVSEADLIGYSKGNVVLNAEVTTSKRPVGTIDERMKSTLSSLSNKKGDKYYFVQTDAMYNRACSKIKNNGWQITCLQIT
jgi:hypothetical protein